MRERKIQLDERLKVYLELEPHKKEFHQAEYQKALDSELQEYHRLLRECEQTTQEKQRRDEIRRGKQPINNINENEAAVNRPGKYPRIGGESSSQTQEFVPGPSKASVMGHHNHNNNNNQKNSPFRNEQEMEINVDKENNNNNNASSFSSTNINNNNNSTNPILLPSSSNSSTEIQTDAPYFHVQSEGQLNKCVDSFYKQYEKEKQEKEQLLEKLKQIEKEKNDLVQMAYKDLEKVVHEKNELQKIIDENNLNNNNNLNERAPSICSSEDTLNSLSHSSNNSEKIKRNRKRRPTMAESLEIQKNDKSNNRSMFNFFSLDKT